MFKFIFIFVVLVGIPTLSNCFSERPILFGINITYIQDIKRVPFILVVCVSKY